jgi:hypothetical protein
MSDEAESNQQMQNQLINQRAQISWVLAILILSMILANIIFSFGHIGVSFYRWIKRRWNDRKLKLRQKYDERKNKDKAGMEV